MPDDAAVRHSSAPLTYFNDLCEAYLMAERLAGGPVNHVLAVAGYRIRLCFAGPALVPHIMRSLAHLRSDQAPGADLTVFLWDTASSSTKMLPPAWKGDDYGARGEIRNYNTRRIHTAYHMGADTLNMLDTETDYALFWTRDAGRIPYYEKGAPLRTILNWWVVKHELQLVHAAAVGTTDGGILIAGKGGSGKSTIALSCISSGLLYAGDDYVLLSNKPYPFVYSIYSSGKTDAAHLKDKLPSMLSCLSNAERTDTEKGLIFLHEHYPGKIAKSFPVKGILLPRITGGRETRVRKISPAEALKALAPSTLFQLAGAGRETFRRLGEFVKQVPGYVMEFGAELERVPELILDLIVEK